MFGDQNVRMTRPLALLLISILVSTASGQAPPGMGKGKGKGRPPATSPTPPPATTNPTAVPDAAFFEQRILPVLQQKCFNCHQTGRKTKGGLAVDSHAALLAGGDSGPALVPGDAVRSLLYISMTYEDEDVQMPPKERLSAAVLADFRKWIEMGAPFFTAVGPVASAPPAPSGRMVTITGIRGKSVTYTESNSAGGMRRGKGKGGLSRTEAESSVTRTLADNALITSATLTRRTQELIAGLELSAGLSNPVFDAVKSGGVRAHLVVKDEKITRISVITAQEESDAPIAVKPKRPPSK